VRPITHSFRRRENTFKVTRFFGQRVPLCSNNGDVGLWIHDRHAMSHVSVFGAFFSSKLSACCPSSATNNNMNFIPVSPIYTKCRTNEINDISIRKYDLYAFREYVFLNGRTNAIAHSIRSLNIVMEMIYSIKIVQR